ncbi:MAG: aminodeoxychorismate/anthranilate synthase component II, partial [Okeania sp. SIO2H7]|nr:aminodeoxychorismate/anthranilate synthase component II [Okeania sp. SIO2H7]
MIVVIDNYDSFTYNLVQYLGELGTKMPVAAEIKVYRNDKITVEEIRQLKPAGVVISP